MANLADFLVRLSGGAANTDPTLALGGAMSTVVGGKVLSQTQTGLTITGVTIVDVMGNAVGSGSLFFDQSANTLRWTPPSGTAGTPVDVTGDGDYAIQGGADGGVLLVTIVNASLPGSDATNTLVIANRTLNVFDNVSKAEAKAGDTEYRGLYFENSAPAADDMTDAKFWVENNTPGQDVINLANADEAKNVAIETIADENTAPSGPDFDTANPVDFASGLLLTTPLNQNDFEGWWVRRTVPADVSAAEDNNTFRIGFRIFV
jgi:hypothetical protein